jgi:hypothetical protein
MTEKTYLTCAETAKLVRGALKKAFPTIKFSVRSHVYAGGASIDVNWTDGPSTKDVESVTNAYAGGGFDGMIDMAYSKESWLMPDGSAAFGSCPGTQGSMGVDAGYDYKAPSPQARKVSFGANFIFCTKHYSVPVFTAAVEKVCAEYGLGEAPEIKTWNGAKPYLANGWVHIPSVDQALNTMVHLELQKENQ